MKNNKTIYRFLIVAFALAILASCKQDVIFYDLAQEIQYEEPIVQGNISSMVPCNGELFVQNNLIYTKSWNAKKSQTERWSVLDCQPASGKYVIRLASDASYLYALIKENAAAATGTVWAVQVNSDSLGEWTEVASNVKELYDNRIFAPDGTTTGRNAYFTDSSNNVKKLAGKSAPVTQIVTDVITLKTTDITPENPDVLETPDLPEIKTAASDGTTDYFSSNPVFAVIAKEGATYLYSSFDGTSEDKMTPTKEITYKQTGTDSWREGGTTQSIITVLTANDSTELLVGTQAGYETSVIGTDGMPANGVTPSGENDNAESAFGTRYVTGIWHYGDSGTLYAAVIGIEHSKYNKLWGRYSGEKWNYE